MGIAAKNVVYRATRAVRAANRERRRALARDMAGFSSAADRRDFQATLDRYPDQLTAEMRDVLAGQERQRTTERWLRTFPW
jgi:hypothetical protein